MRYHHSRPLEVLSIVAALAILGGRTASNRGSGASKRSASDAGGYESQSDGDLSPHAEVARLRIERDRLAQANELLEQELSEAHEDLKRVERQFAVYEQRLTNDQGKADAVAATAEARIRWEKLERERPSVLDDSTGAYVKQLIATSESLIRRQGYASALFFAERANHTMSSAERRASVEGSAVARKVTVDSANVRQGPGQDYAIVDRVSRGAILLCWGEANEWFHVRTPAGVEGWVHVSLVR
jgi:hypothetical protein